MIPCSTNTHRNKKKSYTQNFNAKIHPCNNKPKKEVAVLRQIEQKIAGVHATVYPVLREIVYTIIKDDRWGTAAQVHMLGCH